MAIKVEIAPINIEIEIPKYGKFTVTPLGAGAEAEIRMAFRKIDEAVKEVEKYKWLVDKEKAGEKIDQKSDEYKEAIAAFGKTGEISDEATDLALNKLKAVIRGKNSDKLFNDFTYAQLWKIYRKAIGEDGKSL